MPDTAPQRPIDYAEETLVTLILEGAFPPGSALPAERELAARLGITRPTLREALRYLERDGWLTVRQGKSTQVNDIWRDGHMNVVTTLVRRAKKLPADFIPNLLRVRLDIAPSYFEAAARRCQVEVEALFERAPAAGDSPETFATFDWAMHREMTLLSGNPIYVLILNGFTGFYEEMARIYFASAAARQTSHTFYQTMLVIARRNAVPEIRPLVEKIMRASLDLWAAGQTRR